VTMTASELVSGLDAELRRLGYRDSTLVWYRGCGRRLEKFFAARGVEEFSLDVAMAWVDQACGGFFEKEQAGTLKPTDVYLSRVAAMLGRLRGPRGVLRGYSRTVDRLCAEPPPRWPSQESQANLGPSTCLEPGLLLNHAQRLQVGLGEATTQQRRVRAAQLATGRLVCLGEPPPN
jgi:hypothetical protein